MHKVEMGVSAPDYNHRRDFLLVYEQLTLRQKEMRFDTLDNRMYTPFPLEIRFC